MGIWKIRTSPWQQRLRAPFRTEELCMAEHRHSTAKQRPTRWASRSVSHYRSQEKNSNKNAIGLNAPNSKPSGIPRCPVVKASCQTLHSGPPGPYMRGMPVLPSSPKRGIDEAVFGECNESQSQRVREPNI